MFFCLIGGIFKYYNFENFLLAIEISTPLCHYLELFRLEHLIPYWKFLMQLRIPHSY